jgi:hypothetical protein
MAEPNVTERLTAVRDLLREGRTTEADRALDTIQNEIREEAERIKREMPPPTPKSLAQLEGDFNRTVTDLLGNNPRLAAILTEIEGKTKAAE